MISDELGAGAKDPAAGFMPDAVPCRNVGVPVAVLGDKPCASNATATGVGVASKKSRG